MSNSSTSVAPELSGDALMEMGSSGSGAVVVAGMGSGWVASCGACWALKRAERVALIGLAGSGRGGNSTCLG